MFVLNTILDTLGTLLLATRVILFAGTLILILVWVVSCLTNFKITELFNTYVQLLAEFNTILAPGEAVTVGVGVAVDVKVGVGVGVDVCVVVGVGLTTGLFVTAQELTEAPDD
jgi:hypothetical protein